VLLGFAVCDAAGGKYEAQSADAIRARFRTGLRQSRHGQVAGGRPLCLPSDQGGADLATTTHDPRAMHRLAKTLGMQRRVSVKMIGTNHDPWSRGDRFMSRGRDASVVVRMQHRISVHYTTDKLTEAFWPSPRCLGERAMTMF